jgi:NitT/TauT family transport system substrate-binding protein
LFRNAMSFGHGPRRRAVLGLAATALLAMTTGCSALGSNDTAATSGNASVEKSKINISVLTAADLAPLYLADQNGYFKQEGLELNISVAASGAATLTKLVGGESDIIFSSYVGLFVAQSKKIADIKLVADAVSASPNSLLVMTKPNSSVKSVQDLAGKKIAITAPGTASDTLTKAIMKANDVDFTKVSWVPMAFTEMSAALGRGDVDAAFMSEPFITQAAKTVGAVPVVDVASGATADFPVAGFAALGKFVSGNPKTVAAFQRAMKKATDESADRAKIEPLIVKFAKVDADTAALITLPNYHSTMDPRRLQRVPDLLQEFGLIDARVDVTPMLAPQAIS